MDLDKARASATMQVSDFLSRTYPCSCGGFPDGDCPGEIVEAEEIVRIVLSSLGLSS